MLQLFKTVGTFKYQPVKLMLLFLYVQCDDRLAHQLTFLVLLCCLCSVDLLAEVVTEGCNAATDFSVVRISLFSGELLISKRPIKF